MKVANNKPNRILPVRKKITSEKSDVLPNTRFLLSKPNPLLFNYKFGCNSNQNKKLINNENNLKQ